jgi:hypothetical protein
MFTIYSSYPARVIIYDPYLGKVYHICTVSALCNAIYGYNLLITWHVDLCLLYLVIYKTVFFHDVQFKKVLVIVERQILEEAIDAI